ncbi:hypothetical protein EJ03DRAFT_386100 [Teratosphaeria nubilosa]|uniref:Uncharacterized protein n=1 Tax=Teratosphaeria nubilosa TaxID=161662 RepID=A0A6G1KVM2_9PEZI|nr:hypothetical protein EJ03DRAFT_386100 [Teratosphaeria nubilosa]
MADQTQETEHATTVAVATAASEGRPVQIQKAPTFCRAGESRWVTDQGKEHLKLINTRRSHMRSEKANFRCKNGCNGGSPTPNESSSYARQAIHTKSSPMATQFMASWQCFFFFHCEIANAEERTPSRCDLAGRRYKLGRSLYTSGGQDMRMAAMAEAIQGRESAASNGNHEAPMR